MFSELINWPVIVETNTCEGCMLYWIVAYCTVDVYIFWNRLQKASMTQVIVTWNISCHLSPLYFIEHKLQHKSPIDLHLYVCYKHYRTCKLYVWLVWFIDIIEVTGKRARTCKQKCCERDWKITVYTACPLLTGQPEHPVACYILIFS